MSDIYTPPKVWSWDKESGGKFAAINRPIAGATHDKGAASGQASFPALLPGTRLMASKSPLCLRSYWR